MSVETGREGGFLTFFLWEERISDSEPSKGRVRSENWLYVQEKFNIQYSNSCLFMLLSSISQETGTSLWGEKGLEIGE